MYIPTHFAENDRQSLQKLIEANNFGTLISARDERPFATHLPFIYDAAGSRLLGHMARANPHWQSLAKSTLEALVMFQGPHAYISPTWYETDNVVPTWNYVAVHVYGTFRLDDSRSRRLEIVRSYIDFYEATMDPPWSLDNADNDFIDNLLDAIVGFTIDIERIEGKWKLNQNHDPERRTKVVRALREAGGEDRERIAYLTSHTLEDRM